MNIAIIGAGLIGRKRVLSLPKGISLTTTCDIDAPKGEQFAAEFNCQYEADWQRITAEPKITGVFVATTHDCLADIAAACINKGKHVLIEKPGAIGREAFKKIITAYRKNKVVVVVGYNHRYHPAIRKAKETIDSKKFGPVLFIRARYGHGGRVGYEKEWRFKKAISGGGQLIDQGTHLIDLTNFFIGNMDVVTGLTETLFWNTKAEDSAFLLLKSNKGQIAQLSTTCLEWKNIFSFEIMLQKAKIQIDGLGGSYGREKLTIFKMKPQMGPPDVEQYLFPKEDNSWKLENAEFFRRIKEKDYSDQAINNAKYVLDVVDKIYRK